MTDQNSFIEAKRLEDLWRGEFGSTYIKRNKDAATGRQSFWKYIFKKYPIKNVLEVGCNIGANLEWIARIIPPSRVFGVDINEHALQELRHNLSTVNAILSPARALPFRDGQFDLVFTAGVLIHQPDSTLPMVMAEIVRCSRRYMLCMEYFAEKPIEIPYHDQRGVLFKRNYGCIYQEMFPISLGLKFFEKGFLDAMQGWDNVTYWLFEKT